MGTEIAKVLAKKNKISMERSDGFISVGSDTVTWQFGHILELKSAEQIDPKYAKWEYETLPIIPTKWERTVKKDCIKQFDIIKGLVDIADEIVHAGDPDREGELLIRETLIHLNNTKPVKRILLNALDEKSILYALDNLKDDSLFQNLYVSAEARTRVMTPTFSLVVQRENEIRNFKPVTHYSLEAVFKHQSAEIKTKLKIPDEIKVNDYVTDKASIEAIANKLKIAPMGIISDYKMEKKTEYQLLPYSLSDLQLFAGKKFGYDPQMVLDTVQSLYEKKLTTYPRSDCSYLPKNQFADAGEILNNLSGINESFQKLVAETDTGTKSKAWNDKKITAHHAIIPTTKPCEFENLSDSEKNIYTLIATCYIAQFYKPHIYNKAAVEITCNDLTFMASGKTVLEIGWKKLYSDNKTSEENILPVCSKGDKVVAIKTNLLEAVTKPPKRFTTATLLEAMKKIERFVQNPELKATLKDISGIGTEATRAAIIEKILDKNFIEKDKQNLVPTKYGETIYEVLPSFLKTPDITAVWENQLAKIADGTGSVQNFINGQLTIINEALRVAKNLKLNIDIPRCPYCNNILRQVISKKNGQKYWICKSFFAEDETKCKNGIFSDHNDNPVIISCKKCRKGYMKKKFSHEGKPFWSCDNYPDCKNMLPDKNGLPGNPVNKNNPNRKKRFFK